MKSFHISIITALAIVSLASSCKKSWLDPKPLSFYTPENTFDNEGGFDAALAACEHIMRSEFMGDGMPQLTEMILSDIAVEGTTDKAGPQMDLDISLLPDANLNNMDFTRVGWYWENAYKAIQYANIIISRSAGLEFKNEAEKNRILGQAYFHRAYWYYKLVHQFGDVPYIDQEINEPRTDYYSNSRWDILARLKTELETAYQHVPQTTVRGRVNKGAVGTLLVKIYLSLGEFQKAIDVGKQVVATHPLMNNRFTVNQTKPRTNLMHDLHSVEAKIDLSNSEGILYIMSYPNVLGSIRSQLGRQLIPRIVGVTTPDGKTGIAFDKSVEPALEINSIYGRGIGRARLSNYYQYTVWTAKEKDDLRGVYNRDSWVSPADLKYNDPNLKKSGNVYYGKNLVKNPAMSVEDSIRSWYQWPHFKTFVPDPLSGDWNWGGETPMYIYRSAEVYLLIAEAYYWMNNLGGAAEMLNLVRSRAKASPLLASEVNIGSIVDERARELYFEENRHLELTRIAFIYAKTGKSCEYFGRTYKLETISGPSGSSYNKQPGYNFYFDWVMQKNNFYNKGVKHRWAEYKMSNHHILWPVPAAAINANTKGTINQNIGYPGAANNISPKPL
ncbi:RagB/SusD family nutrient uptake outer membrane protein [Sphingobacterium sp. DK4209]|uniref:RagB/SusD family nutrient uptake outer membrane protein n=1 Tax=Sphingobacterium zhuxiongii TaxID=2662364 RepID=A0A5Q0QEY9_9SPHI|nr:MULTISPECIES: RagB/SusD family nutrient uptake outer membrane protein [unclassified Sphingobacterium]MVZ65243.1 RagB/SusD family nutrient uptake outer membrane protein [Sphingobacterium sp. DK4209]QGA26338.1 RagB/SusD family nutrient uptake outer membrane protein [Sphingobacterium sp. dk4302]